MKIRVLAVVAVAGVLGAFVLRMVAHPGNAVLPARRIFVTRFSIAGDFPPSVVRMACGDLIVCGLDSGRMKRGDSRFCYLARRTAAGDTVWDRWLDGKAVRRPAVGPSQGIYTLNNTTGRLGALTVSRFDLDGKALWTKVIERRGMVLRSSAFGVKGELCVVGMTGAEPCEPYVVKCDRIGSRVWSKRLHVPGRGSIEEALDVSIEGSGDVYVSGATDIDPTSGTGGFVCKLDRTGSPLWMKHSRYARCMPGYSDIRRRGMQPQGRTEHNDDCYDNIVA